MEFIGKLFYKYKNIISYGMYSVFITLIDIAVVWFLKTRLGVNIVLANTIGVITGSIIQYFMIIGNVFNKKIEVKTALVFFSTFLLGLFLADISIYVSYGILVERVSEKLAFLISKGFSIILPFFIMYGIRKYIYDKF